MYKWKPSKWLKWAPPMVGLPLLAAVFIASPSLWSDLHEKVSRQAPDLKVELDARDATVKGEAASQDEIDAAVKAVAGTYGVRRAESRAVILPPVQLAAPTLSAQVTNNPQPMISGTWPEGAAKTLAVTLAGKAYQLGKDPELTSINGTWTLKPAALADGSYDLSAEITDGKKAKASGIFAGGLVIDTVAPPQAKLAASPAGAVWPYIITGTWPFKEAASLAITLKDRLYKLGTDAELTSDGNGAFSFAPKVDLEPGSYDLKIDLSDFAGNKTSQTIAAAIVIPEPPTPAPQPEAVTPAAPLPLVPPTVSPITALESPVVISGTWDNKTGKSVAIGVAGKSYDLASGVNAKPDGTWSLALPPLADGTYDVAVRITDSTGAASTDSTKDELIIDLVPPTTPTINPVNGSDSVTSLSGTFGSADTSSVKVSIPAANLAPDMLAMKSEGNTWTATLPSPLPPGVYDVVVEAVDAYGKVQRDTTINEITITASPAKTAAAEPPKAAPALLTPPTVDRVSTDKSAAVVTGTWPAGAGNGFTVSVAGDTYVLGQAPYSLLSGTNGKWTLSLAKELKNGIYDIVAKATSADGQSVSDETVGELEIAVPPPPEPKKEEQPASPQPVAATYDCNMVLEKIAPVFPIRFEFARTKLKPPFDMAVKQYAALLNDPRCAGFKVEIEGHADYIGPRSFNQFLSELRAMKIRDVLVEAGIAPERLATKGYSEMSPIDPAKTREARARNRRVQFRAVQ